MDKAVIRLSGTGIWIYKYILHVIYLYSGSGSRFHISSSGKDTDETILAAISENQLHSTPGYVCLRQFTGGLKDMSTWSWKLCGLLEACSHFMKRNLKERAMIEEESTCLSHRQRQALKEICLFKPGSPFELWIMGPSLFSAAVTLFNQC